MTAASKRAARHPRVADWSDERAQGNSLIVELRPGWKFDIDPAIPNHVAGFDRVRDAERAVARAQRCDCSECRAAVGIQPSRDGDAESESVDTSTSSPLS